ncbi:MAG: hypothetical protein F4145_09815 [Boseongicola sp. SB0675_bin_26]|nr:hypothetical protein [Boseongicola sp. SB0667_bin_21]MYH58275.1 hypothetical protein [Boseongicola sp. SB0675_bin_26]
MISDITLKSIRNIEAASVFEIIVDQYTSVLTGVPSDGGWKDPNLIKRCKGDLQRIAEELSYYETFGLAKDLLGEVKKSIDTNVCGTVEPMAQQPEPGGVGQGAYPEIIDERICLNDHCTRWIIP